LQDDLALAEWATGAHTHRAQERNSSSSSSSCSSSVCFCRIDYDDEDEDEDESFAAQGVLGHNTVPCLDASANPA
jgi:hypothetical protein